MANAGVETSRIRDVVRNSKIRWDIPLKPDLKFDSSVAEADRNSDGLRHNSYYDAQLVDGVFPHVHMAEVGRRCYHGKDTVRERNRSWFRSILPTFDGSPIIEEFWEWVDSIEDYFKVTQPPEKLKCKMASYTLENEAESWWLHLQHDRVENGKLKIYSWTRMKRMLAMEFLHYRCLRKVPSEYKGAYVRSEKPKRFSATAIKSSQMLSMFTTAEQKGQTDDIICGGCNEKERKSGCEYVAKAHSNDDEIATKGLEKFIPNKCSTEVLLESYTTKHDEGNELKSLETSGLIHKDNGIKTLDKSKPFGPSIAGAHLVAVCVDESDTEQDLNMVTEYSMIDGIGKKIPNVTETRKFVSYTVLKNTFEMKGIVEARGHINSSQLVAKAKCTESYQQEPLYTPGFASYEVQKVKLLARNFVESSSLLSSNKNYTDPLHMDAFMFDPGGKIYLSGNCEEARSEENDLVLVKGLSACDEKSLGNEPMLACDKVLIREFIAFKVFLVIQRCCEPSFNMLRSKDASSITRTGGCRKLGEEGSHWLVIQNLEAVDGSSDRKDVKPPGVVLDAFNQDGASFHHSTRSNLLRGNISPWLHTVIDFGSSVFIPNGYCKPICVEFAKFKLDQSKESITVDLEAKGSSNKGQKIDLQEGFDPNLVDLKHAVVSLSREFSFNARDLPYFPNVPTPRPLFRCVILFGGTLSYLFDPGGNRQSMKILLIGLMVVRSALIPWLSPHSTLTFKFGVQQVVKNQNLTVAVCLKLGHMIVFIADSSFIPMVDGILLQGNNVGNISGMGSSLFSSFAESSSLNLHSSNWEFLSFVYNRDEDLLTNITCILYSMGCLLDIHQSLLHNSPRIFVTTVEFPFDPDGYWSKVDLGGFTTNISLVVGFRSNELECYLHYHIVYSNLITGLTYEGMKLGHEHKSSSVLTQVGSVGVLPYEMGKFINKLHTSEASGDKYFPLMEGLHLLARFKEAKQLVSNLKYHECIMELSRYDVYFMNESARGGEVIVEGFVVGSDIAFSLWLRKGYNIGCKVANVGIPAVLNSTYYVTVLNVLKNSEIIKGELVFIAGKYDGIDLELAGHYAIFGVTRIEVPGVLSSDFHFDNYDAIKAKLSIVTISSCLSVLCTNGQSREFSKLFHNVTNGLDPPLDLDGVEAHFAIVYTKCPDMLVDLAPVTHPKSKVSTKFAHSIQQLHDDLEANLEKNKCILQTQQGCSHKSSRVCRTGFGDDSDAQGTLSRSGTSLEEPLEDEFVFLGEDGDDVEDI